MLLLLFLVAFLRRFGPLLYAWGKRRAVVFKDGHWRSMLNALLPMGLIPLVLGAYMFYLWHNWHDPLLFSHGEEQLWGRHLSWPWSGIVKTLQDLLFTTKLRDARNLTDLLFTLVPLLIIVLGRWRIPLDYFVFALSIALFSLLYPWPGHALSSAPRFLLIMSPVAVVLALWSKHPGLKSILEVLCITFFVINTLLFVLWNWVA